MKNYLKVLGIVGVLLVSLILFKLFNRIVGITFFIIGIGLLVYFGFVKKNGVFTYPNKKLTLNIPKYIEPKEKDTEELVISLCNEDESWVDYYAQQFKMITVYNKCGRVVKFKSPNVKVIESPNIGSCDYAYLSYIIDRYNTLPDFIEFTKGSVKPTKEYNNCLPCKEDEDVYKDLMKFKLRNHKFGNKLNSFYDQELWYNSGYKNMNLWIKDQDFLTEELYKRNTCNLIYGGHFGATKEQILKTHVKVWKALRNQQKNPREEVDHFIERTWRPLLCKPLYKLVIVAIFKNESVAMREWLEHYMREGVQHFYMIDNGSTDNWQTLVEGYPVTIYTDTEKHKQVQHYNDYFLEEVKRNSEWVMVVDARKGHNTIPDYLETIDNNINEVQVRWKMFGSNGHIEQPKSIIKGFTKRKQTTVEGNNTHVKSICRSSKLDKFNIHTHVINGENSNPTPESDSNTSNRIIILPNILNESEIDSSPLHLNHYCIQSFNWFQSVKMTRGSCNSNNQNNSKNKKYFDDYDTNDIEDNELVDKMRETVL
jgi:hypothetical protein